MASAAERAPSRGFLGMVLAIVLGVALSAGVLELAVRFVLDDGLNFDLEMWKYAKDLKAVSPTPGVGHEHVPDTSGIYMGVPVSINSAKLRDREMPLAKPAGMIRIAMVGDSFTFGWGVRVEDTMAKMLEAKLNAGLPAPRFEVVNFGVGNYNTSMEVASFLHDGYRFQPNVVILNYFINDAEETPKRGNNVLAEHSYAAVYIAGLVDVVMRTYFGKSDWRAYYDGLYETDAPGWRRARQAIADLAGFCRERGIGLLVVNLPELHQLDPYPFERVTAAIGALAAKERVPFLDLLPAIRGHEPLSLWVTPTDPHPNATANRAFTDAIAAKLGADFPDLAIEGD